MIRIEIQGRSTFRKGNIKMANFIALAGTMDNAIAWKATPDKFIFAQDCLDAAGFEETLTDNPDKVEAAVELLEAVFEGLLSA